MTEPAISWRSWRRITLATVVVMIAFFALLFLFAPGWWNDGAEPDAWHGDFSNGE